MKYRLVLYTVFAILPQIQVWGQLPLIWAATDGVKVDLFDLAHPYKLGNLAWDGDSIRIFGAMNEVVAFQVIVETGNKPLTISRAGLDELVHRDSANYSIRYTPPLSDPTQYDGRPIQVFNVNYMEVKEATQASWIQLPSLPSAIDDPLGWKPVQLVPENAYSGKGGYPLVCGPMQNQSIWFEIYIEKSLIPGIYRGNVVIESSEGDFSIPINLEVFNFKLPDENSINAMFYFDNWITEIYMGDTYDLVPRFHRFAHRHRVEFCHAYDIPSVTDHIGRFNGKDFTPEIGYEGPGENIGNSIIPRTFYGTPDEWLDTSAARTLSDGWITFIRDTIPDAITFLYMPDEPDPTEFPFIRTVAENIHTNPGPGKDLKILVTHGYTPALEGYIDIWASVPRLLDKERVSIEKAKGNQVWFYNGGRPHMGAIINDAPATDTRMIPWAAFKEDIKTYFYWHVCHWYHNIHFGPGIDSLRKQNVWQNTITLEKRPQFDEWANGDGVLVYPGRELIHPEEDRGIEGPVSSIRMANFRRGLQDHLYLSMARERGLTELVGEALQAIVPRVFMEVEHGEPVQYELDPDVYTYYRYKLGKAIAATEVVTRTTYNEDQFYLLDVFPNPLSGEILNLRFLTVIPTRIQADLYNLQGQLAGRFLRTVSSQTRSDRTISLPCQGLDLKPGIYLLKVRVLYSDDTAITRVFKIVKI